MQATEYSLTSDPSKRSQVTSSHTSTQRRHKKYSLGPLAFFFFFFSLRFFIFVTAYLFCAVTFMIIYTILHHSSSWQQLYPELKIWQLYNKSLPLPCGHYMEAHSTGLDCFASPLELWITWIKISDITSQWVLFKLHCSLIKIMGCDHYVITTQLYAVVKVTYKWRNQAIYYQGAIQYFIGRQN